MHHPLGREDLPGKEGSLLVPGGLPYGKEQACSVWPQRVEVDQWADFVRRQIPVQNRGEFLTSSAPWHDAERLFFRVSQLGG